MKCIQKDMVDNNNEERKHTSLSTTHFPLSLQSQKNIFLPFCLMICPFCEWQYSAQALQRQEIEQVSQLYIG